MVLFLALLPLKNWITLLAATQFSCLEFELGAEVAIAIAISILGVVYWGLRPQQQNVQSSELEKSQPDFERFFNLSLDLLCVADLEGYFQQLNPAWEKTLGYAREELLAQPFINFVHPGDRAATLAQMDKLRSGTPTIAFENRYRCKQGTYKWLSWTAFPLEAEGAIYAIARDMTERKQSETRNRILLNAIPDMMFRCDAGGRFIDFKSAQAIRPFVPPTQFLGKFVTDVFPNHLGERLMQAIKEAIATGEVQELEYQLRADGRDCDYEARFVAIESAEVLAIVRDITARKTAEKALRQSEARNRALLAAIPDMTFRCRADGTYLDFKPAANAKTQPFVSPQVFLGKKVPEVMPASLARQTLEAIEQAIATSTPQTLEYDLLLEGNRRDYEARIVACGENEILALVRDISDRQAALRDRHQAEARLQVRVRHQEAIAELGRRALATTDFEQLLDTTIALVAQTVDIEYCQVLELLPNGQTLFLRAALGWQQELVGRATLSAGTRSQAGYTLLTGEPTVVEDLRLETRFRGSPLLHNQRIISGVSVVIDSSSQPFGVLGIHSRQARQFSRDELDFLQAIAQVLATAIARQRSEDRLHLMERAIAASSNGIAIADAIDPHNPIIYANPAFERITGYSATEVIGRNCRFLQGTDTAQPGLDQLRAAIREGKECHTVLRNYRKDGSLFWNEFYISPVFSLQGYLTHFIGIQTDISERKQLEDVMRVMVEETSRRLGDSFFTALVRYLAGALQVRYACISKVVDEEEQRLQTIAFWEGDAWGEELEYDIAGTPCEQAIAEGTCFYPRNVQALFPNNRLLRDRDIEGYWAVPLFDSLGRLLGNLFVMDDRPLQQEAWKESLLQLLAARVGSELERIRAEEALRTSQARLSRILNIAKDAIISVGENHKIQLFNQGAEQIFGYRAEEILGQPLDVLLPEGIRRTHQQYIQNFARSTETSRQMGKRPEVFGKRRDGTVFLAEASISKLDLNEGTIFTVILRDISDRQQAEIALQKSEERFRSLVTNIPGVVYRCVCDSDWTMEFLSDAIAELSGYPAADFINNQVRTFASIIYPEDRETVEQAVGQAVARQQPYILEYRIVRADGSLRWVYEKGQGILNEDEQILRLDGIVFDATERKQAEKALQESEERLQKLIDTNADGLAVIDTNGIVRFVNPAAERLFQRPAAELLDHWLGSLFVVGESAEINILQPDGTIVVTEMRVAEIIWEGENAFLASLRDVTERDRAAAALRKSEEQFRLIFELAPTGIAIASLQGEFIQVNQVFCDLLGYTEAELLSRTFGDITHPDDMTKSLTVDRQLRRGEISQIQIETRYITKEGKIVYAILQAAIVRDALGEPIHCIAQVIDISDRKQAEEAIEQTRNFLQTIVDHLPVAVFVKDARAERFGQLALWNQTSAQLFGFSAQEAIGKTAHDLFSSEQAALFERRDRTAFENGCPEDISEERVNSRSLGPRILHTIKVPLYDSDRNPEYLLCIAEDITERKQAEEALRESEERWQLALKGNNDGIWDWNLKTNEVVVSARLSEMLGYAEAETEHYMGLWTASIHPDDYERVMELQHNHWNQQTPHYVAEYRLQCADGSYKWILDRGQALWDERGNPVRMVGSYTDITERKRAEEQLQHNAFYDSLTDLPNRALFADRLDRAIQHSQQHPDFLFAVLFLDFDSFKVVNDSLGHMVGDELLIAIARRLEACLRPRNILARLGGDEFAILLENLKTQQEAKAVARKIHQELKLPFNLSSRELFINTSIGIALNTVPYNRPEDLLRDADAAMYRAKALGKARYAVFDRTMHERVMARLQLETDLRRALERQELRVYYQPITSLSAGQPIGFEALVRWHHPEQGLISPARFIPIAEETGLIIPLGKWVLQEACRQLHTWQQQFRDRSHLQMSVNLSKKQLAEPDFVRQIGEILTQTGVDASSLKLEITESLLMDNTQAVAAVLEKLRAMEIQLSIDDFGTGYSSLSYLHRFPVNTLKIDRSFVMRMKADGSNSEIVQAIISLAHTLGMDVIAEGIETRSQLAQLQALGCEYGQGYLFAQPLEREAAEVLISQIRQN